MKRSSSRFTVCAGGVAAALILAACGSPGDDDTAATTATSAANTVSSEVSEEPIELKLSDYEAPGTGETIQLLIDMFEEQNPNVTITREYTTFGDYQQNIKLQMSSDTAPCIAEVGQGHTMQGPLVGAGLLRPLDDYAELYGWEALYPGVLSSQNRVADDGKSFGTGSLYAMSLGGNLIGVYYNKSMLEELGIGTEFATLADFEAALQTIKDQGVVPIQLGNLEQALANHVVSALIARYTEGDEVRDWIYGQDGATFDNPAVRSGLETFDRWVQAGFFNEDANGTAYQDVNTRFTDGESPFTITGSWMQVTYDGVMADNVGFMLIPPVDAGDTPKATGGLAGPFGISSKCEHPDVAAKFIDFMVNGGNAQTLYDGGFLPVVLGDAAPSNPVGSLVGMLDSWNALNANDGLQLFLDWSTPSMGDTFFPGIQELMEGRTDVDGLIADVQANWTDFNGS